jgi:hypothetical protein
MVNDQGQYSAWPYLAAAFFCERVLQEQDGVLSAIRVVDRFIQRAQGPSAPEDMPVFSVALTAFLSFKSGAARGRSTIHLRQESPSGVRGPELSLPVLFEGEDRGANLVLDINFQADQEGLYWFDVLLDDLLVTRMPLRVLYQRITTGG